MKTSSKFTLAFGLAAGLALGVFFTDAHGVSHLLAATPKLKTDTGDIPAEAQPAFSFGPVIKKVSPSVVNIYSTKTVRENARMSPFFDDPFFREFFGQQNAPQQRREQSLGSGVIVTEDGYILTNNHVVEGADEIKVALADERTTYSAKIIGTDPQTDLAVIKVEAKKLPAITATDSDNLGVGDVVLAIGNPFGVGQAVTMGIVSAKGRSGMGIVDYEDFIQTDASINPGNSGGALVDAAGRLVGINTAILSRSGGNQGIGFAVPVNLARYVLDRLVADGKVTRGYLGVMIQSVTPELAKEFKLPANRGALIGEVTKGSPAEDAGLKAGDVVTEFNGKTLSDSRQFRMMVAQTPPGTKAPLKLIRDGKEQSVAVKFGELPANALAKSGVRSSESRRSSGTSLFGGVSVDDLDARERRQRNVPSHIQGALVAGVDPLSSAAAAGLRPGDVILEINRLPVSSAEAAARVAEMVKSGQVLLRVWSQGGTHFLVLEARPSKG